MDDYLCEEDKCQLCVSELRTGVYCPDNSCGDLGSKMCSDNENSSIDLIPPNITVNSPVNNKMYNLKSIPLDIELDEIASIYYLDNVYRKNKWIRICSNCDVYSRQKSFKEGFNNLTFKAVDSLGRESTHITRIFNIDSQPPQIHKIESKNTSVGWIFEIQYTEYNLKSIKLNYAINKTNIKTETLKNCISGKKQICFINVNLAGYNGQRIKYWFTAEDIAGNIKNSQARKISL